MMHDEPEPVTLALLDDMETELARSSTVTLAAAPADTRVLPVDVTLPPATIIRAGVKLSTLIHALEVRGMAPARECATEGCERAAAFRFERGDIGSEYCHDCYRRVQATALASAEGRPEIAEKAREEIRAELILLTKPVEGDTTRIRELTQLVQHQRHEIGKLHSQLARRDADAQHRRNFGEEK